MVPVALPPLRERLSDILPLAEHFLALAGGGEGKRLSAEAAALLLSHPWPGNVRELRNAMERVAVLGRRPVVAGGDLAFLAAAQAAEAAAPEGLDLPAAVARLEAALIRRALAASGGKRAEAARLLGIHRQLLYEKLRRYGLEASGNRTEDVGNADDSPG